ncbi:MAG: hypothetical protein KIS78_01355 [Labilithrix sp.]|nr:hypothetical protein [Labilithrix sp.]MCW5831087.1 hypothetical protein [Labilithrix sp.]
MAGGRRRDRSKVELVTFAALTALAAAQLGASCVDGVTPDCSDPAVCAPNPGNQGTDDAGSAAPDAGGEDASDDADDALDADVDADSDGG